MPLDPFFSSKPTKNLFRAFTPEEQVEWDRLMAMDYKEKMKVYSEIRGIRIKMQTYVQWRFRKVVRRGCHDERQGRWQNLHHKYVGCTASVSGGMQKV